MAGIRIGPPIAQQSCYGRPEKDEKCCCSNYELRVFKPMKVERRQRPSGRRSLRCQGHLPRALLEDHDRQCLEKNLEVLADRAVVDVLEIEHQLPAYVINRVVVMLSNLRQTSNTRKHPLAVRVVVDLVP